MKEYYDRRAPEYDAWYLGPVDSTGLIAHIGTMSYTSSNACSVRFVPPGLSTSPVARAS
jgi:hypothetical protein